MKFKKYIFILSSLLLTSSLLLSSHQDSFELISKYIRNADVNIDNKIKNVIMFIGDGMGPNHVDAGEIYKGSPLTFADKDNLKWTYHGYQNTDSLTSKGFWLDTSLSLLRPEYNATLYDDSPNPYGGDGNYAANTCYTDSAAGGTALATGFKTNNANIGVGQHGEKLHNLVEIASSLGKKTGVLSSDKLTGATPSSFLAHVNERHEYRNIIDQVINSPANLIMAEKPNDWTITDDSNYQNKGWDISHSLLDLNIESEKQICLLDNMLADSSLTPSLADLTAYALDNLDNEEGFFLMVEGSSIDTASHANQAGTMLKELLEFDEAVKVASDWADPREDTLMVVTADHETGALVLDRDNATKDNIIDNIEFLSYNHSRTRVRVDVYGDISEFLNKYNVELHTLGCLDDGTYNGCYNYWENTDVFKLCASYL